MPEPLPISEFPELTDPADDDLYIMVDVSEPLDINKTKKIKQGNINRIERVITKRIVPFSIVVSAGDAQDYWTVPEELNGFNLLKAHAAVDEPSSAGGLSLMVHNATDGFDMLADPIIIEEGERTSYTAGAQPAVDTNHDDVATGDRIRFDVDDDGTDAEGLEFILTFRRPAV